MRRFIIADPSKCIGCSMCEYVCAFEKDRSFNPLRSRIRIVRVHPLFSMAMVCRFCDPAPCIIACPRNALKRSSETGIIMVSELNCDGCSWCIPACPYGAITIDPEKRIVMVCDLCGGDPKCVDFCPEEALQLETKEETISWASSLPKLLDNAKVLLDAIQNKKWNQVFTEVNAKMKRLEEKLRMLYGIELETQSKDKRS